MTKTRTPLLLKKLPRAAVVTRQKQRPSSQGPSPISALHSTTIINTLTHTTSQQPPSFQTDLKSPESFCYFSVSPSAPARKAMADTADEIAARFEEQASMQQLQQQKQPSAPKGNTKKNKSSGGGGGAVDPQKKQKDISRALSRLLRHQATNAGIQLDREGYAPLDKVVSLVFLISCLRVSYA